MFLNLEEFEWVEEAPSEKKEGSRWTMIEKGDWVSDGKYDTQDCIVQNNETGKYYQYLLCRSGSYYSGYYYHHREDMKGVTLYEVIPMEETVTIIRWKGV